MFGDPAKHWVLHVITAMCLVAGLAAGDETHQQLIFSQTSQGEYTFDTGVLRGTLRQGGKSHGLSSVVHIPSGARLDGSVGIAGHYRVFTTNKRYGTAAWDWPSTAELQPDGSVRTTWPTAQDHPFEMTALYRWADAQTLDVETTVTARADLSGFESFFASYFDKAFPSPYACVTGRMSGVEATLLPGTKDLGDWLMFIRQADERALTIQDGRWLLEPNPVKWAVMPNLATPLCLRRSQTNGLTAIVMAPPQDCFAVATPSEGDSHDSLYLSLFGRDIKTGETTTTHARLVIANVLSDDEVLALYKRYASEIQYPRNHQQHR